MVFVKKQTLRNRASKARTELGILRKAHNKLKIDNNKKVQEIKYLRRHLTIFENRIHKILSRGKQYTKEVYLGRKARKYKGKGKRSKLPSTPTKPKCKG